MAVAAVAGSAVKVDETTTKNTVKRGLDFGFGGHNTIGFGGSSDPWSGSSRLSSTPWIQ